MKQLITLVFCFITALSLNCQNVFMTASHHEAYATPNTPFVYEFHTQQVSVEAWPTHGIAELNKTGTLTRLTYTPEAGFSGVDTIVLLYKQTQFGGKYALKMFVVHCRERIVVARPDFYSISVATSPVLLPVLDNDTVLNGESPLVLKEVVDTYYGQATIVGQNIHFLPEPGFTGRASILYNVCSEDAGCSISEVLVRIDDENPTFEQVALVPQGYQHIIQLPDGYSIDSSTALIYGSLSDTAPNTYVYTPVGNAVGIENITIIKPNCSADCVETYKVQVIQSPNLKGTTQSDYLYSSVGGVCTFNPLHNDIPGLHIINKLDQGAVNTVIEPDNATLISTSSPAFEGEVFVGYMVKPHSLPMNALTPTVWEQAYIKFSNQHPHASFIRLPVVAHADNLIPIRTQIESYDIDVIIPPIHGTLTWYPGVQEILFNGQSVTGLNQLIYRPQQGFTDKDQATIRRCVGTDCRDIVLSFDIFEGAPPAHKAVWPGDINNDGMVALDDLLSWSYAAGYVTKPRNETGTVFKSMAQSAVEGSLSNLAFADADGNGLINFDDLHTTIKHLGKQSGITSGDRLFSRTPLMSFTTSQIAQPLDTVSLIMELGHPQMPNMQTRCFAFSIYYNTDRIKPGSFHATLNGGYLAQGAVELFVFDNENGRVDIAVMPVGRYTTFGYGQVLTIKFIVDDIIDGFKSLSDLTSTTLKISNFVHGDFDGHIFSAPDQTVEIAIDRTNFVSKVPIGLRDMIRLWPNPSSTYFHVDMHGLQRVRAITITDAVGRLVYERLHINNVEAVHINHLLAAGLYNVRVYTDQGHASIPLLVQSR